MPPGHLVTSRTPRAVFQAIAAAAIVSVAACLALPSTPQKTASGLATCNRPGIDCDVKLAPPTRGIQMTIGPAPVPVGKEILRCFWRKVSRDIDISGVDIAYNAGSHHLDLYTVPYAMPDGDFDCNNPDEWGSWASERAKGLPSGATHPKIVIGFQNSALEWALPPGVVYRLKADQQLLIQSHFADVESQVTPTRRLFNLINLIESTSPVSNEAETLFDEDDHLVIPPRSKVKLTRFCDFPKTIALIGMFGHFHSRGKKFEVFTYDKPTGTTGALIYQSTSWDEPPWYDTRIWGKPLEVTSLKMVATYQNDSDIALVWGSQVQVNEHFETYAMFYPRLDVEAKCICHNNGQPPEKNCH